MNNVRFTFFVVILAITSDLARACITLVPTTDLETVYCEIKKQGKGTRLPPFSEFRKNKAMTQYMLVKRDAKLLGLTAQRPAAATTPTQKISSTQTSGSSASTPRAVKPQGVTSQDIPSHARKLDQFEADSSALLACTLHKDTIQCANQQYRLLNNIAVAKLSAGSLAPGNTLELIGDKDSSSVLSLEELAQAYFVYIDKMVDIGLAASALSLTKFVALYDEQGKQNHRFSLRFKKMYELLKQERRNQGVKARYDNTRVGALTECMRVKPRYIVCDDIVTTWIYQLTPSK